MSRRPVRHGGRFWETLDSDNYGTFRAGTVSPGGLHRAPSRPTLDRSLAAVAIAVTTIMAVAGRLSLGMVVDRLDPRWTTAVSLATQASALFVIALSPNVMSLFLACAVYGFSIGNLITLPPLIIHREFDRPIFGTVLGLSTAIGGMISALGPGLVGLVRAATGGYTTALLFCLMLKLVAAVIVLLRPRQAVGS
jgi:cyanate permease